MAFLIIIYLVDIIGKEHYDVNVVYVSSSYTTYDEDTELEKRLEQYAYDYDENGEVNVKLYNYTIPEELKSQEDADQQLAMLTRFQVEIADGRSFIYIFDEKMYDDFEISQAVEDLTYTNSDKIEESVKYMLDGTELVKDLSIDGRGDFMVLRSMYGLEENHNKRDEWQVNHDRAKEVLENIINNNKVNQ